MSIDIQITNSSRLVKEMSRFPLGKAAATRLEIIASAARLYRQHGLNGIGISAVMADLGLTVGGFYSHFESKDDLVAEALLVAVTPVDQIPRENLDLVRALQMYLSAEHRDLPGEGCVLVATAEEASRSNERIRVAFTDRLNQRVDFFDDLLEIPDVARRRSYALLIASACVGAVGLARAVADKSLSAEILIEVKALLETLAAAGESVGFQKKSNA